MTLNDPIDNHDSEKILSESDSSSNELSRLANNYTKQLLRRKVELSDKDQSDMDFIELADHMMMKLKIITALVAISIGLKANDKRIIVAAFNSSKER